MMTPNLSDRLFKKLLTSLFFFFAVSSPLAARFIVGSVSFQEMFNKADLVLIATPTNTTDTTERKKLIDIDKTNTTAPEALQDLVVGVETEFQTRVVLKGAREIKKIVLHHYRLQRNEEEIANGPEFIHIGVHQNQAFLLFLIKEKDGKYAPVTGQFDAAVLSVLELKSATADTPLE